MDSSRSEFYRAIVDMGSNGVRFSITDLSPPTQRIMPTIYQDRAGISLYDAQWATGTKQPIPDDTIEDVIRALLRFKQTCADFGVRDPENVRLLATEATRVALNSEVFRERIFEATGWKVEMLPKEEEGRVGAMGVISSFSCVNGLMMDLGGGSTQITWLIAKDGNVEMSPAGSVSMPYGAAALIRRLEEAQKEGNHALNVLKEEITQNLIDAVKTIGIPQTIFDHAQESPDGLTLHLSGGGFRGWGFLLMSQHPVSPYPCPIINGFKANIASFENVALMQSTAANEPDIFRVSERRASQVPAVALLVSCMITALPAISTVRFAQGGVREGAIFNAFPPEIRAQHPLVTATSLYTTPSTPLIHAAIKDADQGQTFFSPELITALAQALYLHNPLNKELKSAAALRSTTTGALAGVHGASHDERAALGVALCERWGGLGNLPPGEAHFYQQLLSLLGPEHAWWSLFFGRVAGVIGEVYPAGVVRSGAEKVRISLEWVTKEELKSREIHKEKMKWNYGDADLFDYRAVPGAKNTAASSSGVADGIKEKVLSFPIGEKIKEKKDKKKGKKHGKDKKKSASPSPSPSESEKDAKKAKKSRQILLITFDFGAAQDIDLLAEGVQGALRHLEKLGKKKQRIDGFGHKIDLRIVGAGDGGEVDGDEEDPFA